MPRVLSIREERPEERGLDEWFAAQKLESPKNMEEAARLIIGLVTGLLGALFGVLTISAETLPAYLALPVVRWVGAAAVVLWLLALLFGLLVVLPRRWQVTPARPASEDTAFTQLLHHKSRWLTACAICFGLGILALGLVLIIALLAK